MVGFLKRFIEGRKRMDPEAFRRAKPLRNPSAEWEKSDTGDILIRVPLDTPNPILRSIARRANWPTSRQFELEAIGAFVWEYCDGNHSNETITRKLRERYKMNRLEAEASLSAFLQMLSQKGLITLLIGTKK